MERHSSSQMVVAANFTDSNSKWTTSHPQRELLMVVSNIAPTTAEEKLARKNELKARGSSSSNQNSQNVAFVYSNNSGSCNQAYGSNSANTDSMSDAVIYSFFANQSNSPHLNDEDLQRFDASDQAEKDLQLCTFGIYISSSSSSVLRWRPFRHVSIAYVLDGDISLVDVCNTPKNQDNAAECLLFFPDDYRGLGRPCRKDVVLKHLTTPLVTMRQVTGKTDSQQRVEASDPKIVATRIRKAHAAAKRKAKKHRESEGAGGMKRLILRGRIGMLATLQNGLLLELSQSCCNRRIMGKSIRQEETPMPDPLPRGAGADEAGSSLPPSLFVSTSGIQRGAE
ncbi:hypothetical protein Tco_0282424 [Tanacetum coccineum]